MNCYRIREYNDLPAWDIKQELGMCAFLKLYTDTRLVLTQLHQFTGVKIVAIEFESKLLKQHALKYVNVVAAAYEKAIDFPTDVMLYHRMSLTLVRQARKQWSLLRQNFKKTIKILYPEMTLCQCEANETPRQLNTNANTENLFGSINAKFSAN